MDQRPRRPSQLGARQQHGMYPSGNHCSRSQVGRYDYNISTLAAKTKSIFLDIVGFQNCMASLQLRIASVEDRLNTIPARDQELLFLCSKVIDTDRSCRDNVPFFGIPECMEEPDIKSILKNILSALTASPLKLL
ncbi:hypothetical protein NDU88_002676 [Pleurodeles waltl]|uniref:Uncharacterized protein n=1 Tax=Pleurodeles waltl TaxID=8319 RepID=A0AAV7NID6_PLEWA|nr:hypothetical protein NDU88_002676 [Pleurodeles waltl]